jgi:hypothetical protein
MRRNLMYPNTSMQCDEEQLARADQHLKIARQIVAVVEARRRLISYTVYIRSCRRSGCRIGQMLQQSYYRALDDVWAAQEGLE